MSEMASVIVPKTDTEICVICRKDTGIPSGLPVDHPERLGSYVETCGQLCPACFGKVYGPVLVFLDEE